MAARLVVERGGRHVLDLRAPILPDRVRAIRFGDLIDVTFRFQNLTLVTVRKQLVLQRKDAAKPARLIIVLPSQSIAEGAYVEVATAGAAADADLKRRPSDPDPTPAVPTPVVPPPAASVAVPTLMAGPSQLVFDVADAELNFTLTGLLEAVRRLPMVVGRNAPTPKDFTILQMAAVDLTADRGRLRRAATQFGARSGDGGATGSIESMAQVRANAVALEHRFGREAAATWVVGQLVGDVDRAVIDKAFLGPVMRRPARPADPFIADVTGIEMPFRLLLSPHAEGAFELRSAAPAAGAPTELWHARLGLRSGEVAEPVDEAPSPRRTVRAVWTRDKDLLPPGDPADDDFPWPDPFGKGAEPTKPGMRLSLNANDRLMIVHQSSDFSLKRNGSPWTPPAIPVDRLFLSTLGGWLDGGVSWKTQPKNFELEEWRNLATLGRDHYVRIVRAGYLFPTGHRASFVKVTERKFHTDLTGNPALLRQRFFIVVREPYRVIPSLGDEKENRRNPFHDIRITTVVTPPLEAPVLITPAGVASRTCFQPTLDGAPFAFQALVTDPAGNLVEVSIPLLFVGKTGNEDDHAFMKALVGDYNGDPGKKTFPGNTFGQRMAFAPPGQAGDTELAVNQVRLAARNRDVASGPRFGPVLGSASVAIPAVDQLTGGNGQVDVTWPTAYIDEGFHDTKNVGQVFLQLVTAKDLDFATKKDRSGALVAPNLSVKALSRVVGPVGVDPDAFAEGDLDPTQLFSALSGAKLFGVVPLADLIDKAIPADGKKALGQAPAFLTEALTKAAGLYADAKELVAVLAGPGVPAGPKLSAVKAGVNSLVPQLAGALQAPASADVAAIGASVKAVVGNQAALVTELAGLEFGLRRRILGPLDRIAAIGQDAAHLAADVISWAQGIAAPASIRTRVVWHPKVVDWKGIVKFDDPGRALTLAIDLANPPGSSQPLVDVSCSVEGVTVDLEVVKLKVDLIRFSVRGGQKPDIEVQLADPGGVVFGGPLAFVEGLRSLIPLDGFSDPPSVDVGPDGLKAGFSLALPNLAVGIFSLENLSLSAMLDVPFVGESLSFRFSFCSRENPFHLIVSLFGGGGFVGIELTPEGIRMIEASLEFGAAVSLDFGVASGSLSVMAGIYFRYDKDKGVLVSGYFRARGEVDVLGLISASIELTISFTWQEPNKVSGRATLTIEVEVLFFSASVEIACEKRFAGSGSDPTFVEVMGPADGIDPWQEYCRAFVGV